MKILNVDMTLAPVEGGGKTERTFQMSRALVTKIGTCSILTTDYGLTEDRLQALRGIELITLRCLNRRFFIPLVSYSKISNAVKKSNVSHLMGHWTAINVLFYFFARYYKKPYVICPAGSLVMFGRSLILKRLYNILIGNRIMKEAAYTIAITHDEVTQIKSYGISAKRILHIPNGINPENYSEKDNTSFRQKFNLAADPFILFVGGLEAIKGPDMLLKAFNNIKDEFSKYKLVFAGNDRGILDELKRLVRQFNLEKRVHFIGYVGGYTKSRAYHAADLLAIPSRHEAMSIVVLEAGIAGTPVLLTNQCGFNEISDIGGGRVVKATVAGLRSGLIQMLSDPPKLKKMGANLKEHIKSNYTWEIIIKKYLELYRQILN